MLRPDDNSGRRARESCRGEHRKSTASLRLRPQLYGCNTKDRAAGERTRALSSLGREVAGDIENQVGGVGGKGVYASVHRRRDGHVRGDGSIVGIQGRVRKARSRRQATGSESSAQRNSRLCRRPSTGILSGGQDSDFEIFFGFQCELRQR